MFLARVSTFFFPGRCCSKAFIDPRCYNNNSSLIFETVSTDVVTAEFSGVFFGSERKKKSYKDPKVDFLYLFQGPCFDLWQWVDRQVRSVVGLYLQGLYQLSTSLAGAGLDPGLDFSEPMSCRSKVPQRRFWLILTRRKVLGGIVSLV